MPQHGVQYSTPMCVGYCLGLRSPGSNGVVTNLCKSVFKLALAVEMVKEGAVPLFESINPVALSSGRFFLTCRMIKL